MPVILITGAASGLGRATAIHFIENGWRVVAIDINPGVHELSEANPNCICHQVDVTSTTELLALRDKLNDASLSISVIVNNAGMFRFDPITESNEWERLFTLNAIAPFRVIQTFLSHLIETKGRVIQISSENVKMSGLFQPYPSSKIAMESLSIAARQELALAGVDLVIIRPGAIETDLLHWNEPHSAVYQTFLEKFLKQAKEKMSGIVLPEKVATLIFRSATAKRPKRIYNINHNPWLAIFSKFPVAWQERIIRGILKS